MQVSAVVFREVVPGPGESTMAPGCPPEERERVFEAFYRGERSPETPGSGLGLAIANAIVTAHGGPDLGRRERPEAGVLESVVFEHPDRSASGSE